MRKLTLSTVLAAALLAPLGASQTHPNLTYATVGPVDLKLDLYIPATGSAPYPVLIWIHGGGWSGGSKAPIPGPCTKALSQGFAIAALNYRLTSQGALFAPEPVTFPAQIHDIKGAVRWLRANAATYQLDPDRFASHGSSAGGHLSALLATSGGVAVLEGNVGGNLGFSSRVQAAVDFFGPTDLLAMNDDVTTPPGSVVDHDAFNSPESALIGWNQPGQGLGDIKANLTNPNPPYPALVQLLAQANPITWVDASDPPMFIAHGTNDATVPRQQSLRLSAALIAANVPQDCRIVPGAGHGLGGPIDPVVVAFVSEKLIGPIPASVGTAFCAGDGSASTCPCGNATFVGAQTGCAHSLGVGGNLNALGVPSIAADTLVLRGDSMLDVPALYFQGDATLGGGAGVVFGDGLLCVSGSVKRLGAKTNLFGWSEYPQAGNTPISITGNANAGTTLYYQVWYRDQAAYCSADAWNVTNALAITWLP